MVRLNRTDRTTACHLRPSADPRNFRVLLRVRSSTRPPLPSAASWHEVAHRNSGGDRHPALPAQVIMACIVMVTQLVLTSYVMGTIFHLLLFKDNTLELHKEKMERLKKFCHQNELPSDIQDEIFAHFDFQVAASSVRGHQGRSPAARRMATRAIGRRPRAHPSSDCRNALSA